MEAKLKPSYRFPRAVLFSGNEFLKADWRHVPLGFEDQASADDRLLVRETEDGVKPQPIPEEDPEAKAGKRRSYKRKTIEVAEIEGDAE